MFLKYVTSGEKKRRLLTASETVEKVACHFFEQDAVRRAQDLFA